MRFTLLKLLSNKKVDKFEEELKREFENLSREIEQAKIELELADQNFNYAEGDFINIAIHNMKAAELKYCMLVRKAKDKFNEIEDRRRSA